MGQPAEVDTEAQAVTYGRRTNQRARLHLNATLATTAGDHPVVLRNLSCTGAMVELDAALPSGRTVVLRRGVLDELATIVWCRNGFCGLHFLDPIALDTVLDFAARPPEIPSARGSFYQLPAGNELRLTPSDWQSARDSARRRLARGG